MELEEIIDRVVRMFKRDPEQITADLFSDYEKDSSGKIFISMAFGIYLSPLLKDNWYRLYLGSNKVLPFNLFTVSPDVELYYGDGGEIIGVKFRETAKFLNLGDEIYHRIVTGFKKPDEDNILIQLTPEEEFYGVSGLQHGGIESGTEEEKEETDREADTEVD